MEKNLFTYLKLNGTNATFDEQQTYLVCLNLLRYEINEKGIGYIVQIEAHDGNMKFHFIFIGEVPYEYIMGITVMWDKLLVGVNLPHATNSEFGKIDAEMQFHSMGYIHNI